MTLSDRNNIWHTDGTLIRHTHLDSDGMAYGELLQPGRQAILERNAELRKNPDALQHLESMGLELTIPEVDYYILQQKYPELKSSCATTRSLAWAKFMRSSESDPYRVRPRVLCTHTPANN